MHDTHRHAWQGQLRRLLPDADVAEYSRVVQALLGPLYRPEDMYAGNLISALGAIDCGVTCMMDFSHNARTPEHSDAAIAALTDAGIRGIHASSAPMAGELNANWPEDMRRIREERFTSNDQLLTLRLGVVSRTARRRSPSGPTTRRCSARRPCASPVSSTFRSAWTALADRSRLSSWSSSGRLASSDTTRPTSIAGI